MTLLKDGADGGARRVGRLARHLRRASLLVCAEVDRSINDATSHSATREHLVTKRRLIIDDLRGLLFRPLVLRSGGNGAVDCACCYAQVPELTLKA